MKVQSPRVLAVGDLMVELCFVVTDAWSADPDIPVHSQSISCGGSAANFSACLAQLDQEVRLLAQVGSDDFGEFLLDDLNRYGVPQEAITRVTGPSSTTAIIIGADGDRRFLSFRSPAEVDYGHMNAAEAIEGCTWVHISGFVFQRPASAAFARNLVTVAGTAGLTVSIDPSPLFADYVKTDPSLLGEVDYLFPNEYEAQALTGQSDAAVAAADLHRLGVGTAIVTVGDGGCVLHGHEGLVAQLATPPVPDVVDSTGAGDAFAAGFISALQAGLTAIQAAELGMCVAGEVIGQVGGHCGAPTRAKLVSTHPWLHPIVSQLTGT
ncbi:MAG: carbohydrate kinase family protein [Actinomycetales bacterium]